MLLQARRQVVSQSDYTTVYRTETVTRKRNIWTLIISRVNPEAKTLARRERQIDQFQPEPLSGMMIPKHQRIMRFGSRHAPL